jgi:hypothetical protein
MASTAQIESALEHAWRYFELHANQRMAVFNFFLVLSGIVAAGLAAALQSNQPLSGLGVVAGLLLCLVSFVFWKLDQRVSFLVKHAEAALMEAEASLTMGGSRLFLLEPRRAAEARSSSTWWARQWTYGEAFRLVFFIMGLTGLGGALLAAFRTEFARIL